MTDLILRAVGKKSGAIIDAENGLFAHGSNVWRGILEAIEALQS